MGGRFGIAFLALAAAASLASAQDEAETPPENPKRREWLSGHQSADGGWSPRGFESQCVGDACGGAATAWESEVGTTGLALLAFVGYGETHRTPRYGEVVRRASARLLEIQDADGCFGVRFPERFLADHAMATLALAELADLTGSEEFRESARRAITYLLAQRGSDGGWRAGDRLLESDAVTTCWAAMALRSAKAAEIEVADEVPRGILGFLDGVTDPETGMVRLHAFAEPSARATAAAVLARVTSGALREDPAVTRGAEVLLRHLPRWPADGEELDPESWMLGTNACFQVGGDAWKRWNEAMKKAIVDHQHLDRESCTWGSWDPVSGPAAEMGRTATTAFGVLCLEVYYRYSRVFGSKGPRPEAKPAAKPLHSDRRSARDIDFPEPRTGFLR